jgi:hypothetical protein
MDDVVSYALLTMTILSAAATARHFNRNDRSVFHRYVLQDRSISNWLKSLQPSTAIGESQITYLLDFESIMVDELIGWIHITSRGTFPKHAVNAWIDNLHPTSGDRFRVYLNIGIPDDPGNAQASFRGPDWGEVQALRLIVSLSSLNCTVAPSWQELAVPRMGDSSTIHFDVIAKSAGDHEFTTCIYLAEQMRLLQYLRFQVSVYGRQTMEALA